MGEDKGVKSLPPPHHPLRGLEEAKLKGLFLPMVAKVLDLYSLRGKPALGSGMVLAWVGPWLPVCIGTGHLVSWGFERE